MAPPALRPRSPSELVDAAFQLLRAHFAHFIMCSAVAYVPWLVIDLVRASDPATLAQVNIGRTLLLALAMMASFSLMSAVLILCASQAYLGEPIDIGQAVRTAVRRWPRVALSALLRFALIVGAFFFLFLPALYPAARFFAVTPVIVLENAGVAAAFSRSSALSKGRKWHVILTMGLVFLVYIALLVGLTLTLELVPSLVVRLIILAAFTIVAFPVVAITEALLYYDTRIKSEGLDIELLAGALEGVPPPRPAAP